MKQKRAIVIPIFLILAGCVTSERTGDRMPTYVSRDTNDPRLAAYAEATARYAQDPTNEDNIIWLGRRAAYLEQMYDAINVFSDGLRMHPESYRLLRHRGHRWISVRQFDRAVIDLKRAAALVRDVPIEVEPDGMPNAAGVPRSNTQFNIYYHLGLAHYLMNDMESALGAYETCMDFSINDDLRCATTHWMSMTLRRLNRDEEAAKLVADFPDKPDIIENHAYHRLIELYRGTRDANSLLSAINAGNMSQEDVTVGYGLVNWLYLENRFEEARTLRTAILRSPHHYAFGTIAAEADARFR